MYSNTKMVFIAITALALNADTFGTLVYSKDTEKELSIGERFHRDTSLAWLGVIRDLFLGLPKKPPQYKNYPDSKVTKLPEPKCQGISLEKAVQKRRSVQNRSGTICKDKSSTKFEVDGFNHSGYQDSE